VTGTQDGGRKTVVTSAADGLKTNVSLTEARDGRQTGTASITAGALTLQAGVADPAAPKRQAAAPTPGKKKAAKAPEPAPGQTTSVGASLELSPGTTVHARVSNTQNKATTHTVGATLATGTSFETTAGDPKGRTTKVAQKLGNTGLAVGVEQKGHNPTKGTVKVDLQRTLNAPLPASVTVGATAQGQVSVEGSLELAPGVSVYGSHAPPEPGSKSNKANLSVGFRIHQEF
jgi:hypothetical protein